MDDETARYAAILRIKQARLFELDKQAATYGLDVPPHIEMERVSLRDELGLVESAIRSPARAAIGNELGPAGRFAVAHQDSREIKQSIAAVAVRLDQSIVDSQEWRSMHRQWILIIGIVVIIILLAGAILTTYVLTKGAL